MYERIYELEEGGEYQLENRKLKDANFNSCYEIKKIIPTIAR